jgi:hypothetical protein
MMKQHQIIILVIAAITGVMIFQQQSFAQTSEPKASTVNSKYLTIKDVRFRDEGFGSSSITGTIVNKSTSDISFAQVFAALYDQNNNLITTQSGLVDVSSLKPGDNSAFKVSLFGLSSADTVDHYTVMPGGTPS